MPLDVPRSLLIPRTVWPTGLLAWMDTQPQNHWTDFYDRVSGGARDEDVLIALLEFVDACPEFGEAFAAKATTTASWGLVRDYMMVGSQDTWTEPANFTDCDFALCTVVDTGMDIEAEFARHELYAAVGSELQGLRVEDPKAARSIELRFGFADNDFSSFQEIGKDLGVSRQMARRYAQRGTERLALGLVMREVA